MRDAVLVVVVVDDRSLVAAEVLARPRHGEVPQRIEPDAVLRVGRHHVVLVGAHFLAAPGFVVAEGAAGLVHRRRPVGRAPGFERIQAEVVACKRPILLREIAEDPLRGNDGGSPASLARLQKTYAFPESALRTKTATITSPFDGLDEYRYRKVSQK